MAISPTNDDNLWFISSDLELNDSIIATTTTPTASPILRIDTTTTPTITGTKYPHESGSAVTFAILKETSLTPLNVESSSDEFTLGLHPIFLVAVLSCVLLVILINFCCNRLHSDGSTLQLQKSQRDHIEVMNSDREEESDMPEPASPSIATDSRPPPETRAVELTVVQSLKYNPRSRNVREHTVRNVLAVIICIGEYEDDPAVSGLHGIKKDYANLMQHFNYLNYRVMRGSQKNPYWWTEDDIISFLVNDVVDALFEGTDRVQYDALIVCISCHGLENTVITSDLRKIEKQLLHRAVSHYRPKVRNIPRIFIIDACDGPKVYRYPLFRLCPPFALQQFGQFIFVYVVQDRQISESSSSISELKPILLAKSDGNSGSGRSACSSQLEMVVIFHSRITIGLRLSAFEQQDLSRWTTSVNNPDYNLAFICSANNGFQAKIRGDIGSDFIYSFIQKVQSSVEGEEDKTLADICYEIQDELYGEGRSLPVFNFNNQTRNVVFQRNIL